MGTRTPRLRPTVPDAISAGVLTFFVSGITVGYSHWHDPSAHRLDGIALLWVIAGGVPLVWRSRAPLSAYLASGALVFAYYTSPYPGGPSAVLPTLALITLAYLRGPLVAGLGALAMVIAVVTAVQVAGDSAGALDPRQLAIVLWGMACVTFGTVIQLRQAARRSAVERAVEADRRRAEEQRLSIAREVHDVVAHSLAMINVQAGTAAHVADRRPEAAKAALLAIKEASRSALADLRATLGVLRSGDLGIDTAAGHAPTPGLGRLPDLIGMAAAAGVTVEADGDPGALPAPVDVAAYRILQESLTNVVRHGTGADLVVITLRRSPDRLTITVRDNGRAATPGAGGGNGLRGMAERAQALGGSVTAGPATGGGFLVTATLPITGEGSA